MKILKFRKKFGKCSTFCQLVFRLNIFSMKNNSIEFFCYVFRSQIFQRFQKSHLENSTSNSTGCAWFRVSKCTNTIFFLESTSHWKITSALSLFNFDHIGTGKRPRTLQIHPNPPSSDTFSREASHELSVLSDLVTY